MSEQNGKVCCNCRHNTRVKVVENDMILCRCAITGRILSYSDVMEGWCRHWGKDKEVENVRNME